MRPALALCLVFGLVTAPVLAEEAAPERPGGAWTDLRGMIYGDRAIGDAGEMIRIAAPVRAHDAAIVPVEIAIAPPLGRTVAKFDLIVDENPAPVAAEFTVGEGLGREIAVSTRLRVNAYSNVRVVAQLDDGSLWQSARYVKASGGCSAPALKDAEAALAAAGQMKFRVFDGETHEAMVSVLHPNYSGLQIDQVTLMHIPAFYVDEMEVRQGDRMVFRMEGGISLSENPSFRFAYVSNGAPFTVRAADTSGATFESVFPARAGS